MAGQDLQRHVPAERLLLGLVDHAHAAPAHLAEDAEVAQPLQPPARGRGRSGVGPRRIAGAGLDLLDQRQGGEEVADRLGVLGEPLGVLGEVGMLAAAVPRDELLGQAIDRVLIRRARRVHGSPLRRLDLRGCPGSLVLMVVTIRPRQLSKKPGMLARVSLSRLSARR